MWAVYNNEGMAEITKKLRRVIKEKETEKTIIGEDFNARTGKEGYMYAKETMEEREGKYRERKSKDKVKNRRGHNLISLTENRGWHIANENLPGDEGGELTYVGTRGATVIDHSLLDTKNLESVRRCEVGNRIKADHQSLGLYLKSKES